MYASTYANKFSIFGQHRFEQKISKGNIETEQKD